MHGSTASYSVQFWGHSVNYERWSATSSQCTHLPLDVAPGRGARAMVNASILLPPTHQDQRKPQSLWRGLECLGNLRKPETFRALLPEGNISQRQRSHPPTQLSCTNKEVKQATSEQPRRSLRDIHPKQTPRLSLFSGYSNQIHGKLKYVSSLYMRLLLDVELF